MRSARRPCAPETKHHADDPIRRNQGQREPKRGKEQRDGHRNARRQSRIADHRQQDHIRREGCSGRGSVGTSTGSEPGCGGRGSIGTSTGGSVGCSCGSVPGRGGAGGRGGACKAPPKRGFMRRGLSPRRTFRAFVVVAERHISRAAGPLRTSARFLVDALFGAAATRFFAATRLGCHAFRIVFARGATRSQLVRRGRRAAMPLLARRRCCVSRALLSGTVTRRAGVPGSARAFRPGACGRRAGGRACTFRSCHRELLGGVKQQRECAGIDASVQGAGNIHAERTGLNRRQFAFSPLLGIAVGIARQCNCYSAAAAPGARTRVIRRRIRRCCAVVSNRRLRHGNCLGATECRRGRLASAPAVSERKAHVQWTRQ